MTMSDPIADMLTRIRNANTAKHDTVDVPASKMKLAIVQILLDEGYIKKYDILDEGSFKTIHITLKYGEDKNDKIISGIKRISKPGLRVYAFVSENALHSPGGKNQEITGNPINYSILWRYGHVTYRKNANRDSCRRNCRGCRK